MQLYVNAADLLKIADALEVFPRHASDVFLYEIGSERPEDRWAYYFRFRVFTTDGRGHCAIQLRFNNNESLPDRSVAEFCIIAETSRITELGRRFRVLGGLHEDLLEWSPLEDSAAA
ncbi:MAG TPA: hypothetical protein VGQ21_02460 [Thermoanaerobaculia bacterium]|nr:hypothetical protein [Thermoanaerobaculia bacterium]